MFKNVSSSSPAIERQIAEGLRDYDLRSLVPGVFEAIVKNGGQVALETQEYIAGLLKDAGVATSAHDTLHRIQPKDESILHAMKKYEDD